MVRERPIRHGAGRDAILVAALRLIGERGLQSLTMRDIASAAGMSLGSTTYHFSNRDALLAAALQRFADEEIGRLERLLKQLSGQRSEPIQILTAVVSELNGTYARPGFAVAQLELYLAASRDPKLSAIATKCIAAYHDLTWKALLAAGVDPQQATALARWITALVDGFAVHAAAAGTPHQSSPDLADAIETMVRP